MRCSCCSPCAPVLVHDSLALPHLCFALVRNGLILGFASRVMRCVVDSTVDAAADRLADTMDALETGLDVVNRGAG